MKPEKPKRIILDYLLIYCLFFFLSGCAASKITKPLEHISNWTELQNPIFQSNEMLISDFDITFDNGTWYLFYSALYEDSTGKHSRIVEVSTTDFKEFSAPILYFNGAEDGWQGMAHPTITKHRNIYYLTFNSWRDKAGKPEQLFYMTSRDLIHWTVKTPLAPQLTINENATHPALAFDRGKWFLIYNLDKETRMAIARGIRTPFERLGTGTPSFYNNTDSLVVHQKHRFIPSGKKWGLLASGNQHNPYLYILRTQSATGLNWLTWEGGYPLQASAPESAGSRIIESAALVNMQRNGGYFYLFYLIHPDDESTLERGSSKLEVYRSTDLINWTPAGK